MSKQPDPLAKSSRAEISRATHEHGIDAEHTVKPQSREPENRETMNSSGGGTSVTGVSKTDAGAQQVEVGSELGYYRLLKKLGEGGMGSVWQAVHTKLDKHVAVKVLPATWSRDPGLLTRFEREMKAVGKLEHPHIVRAMDAGEFQGTHYLVMEFNEGLDLSAYVKQRGPQSVTNACEMLRHAALGLAHAHEAGLIHRDIKPSNLFLTKSGKVKILDLGLARVQGDNTGGGQTLTGFGQVLGTPDYMAPEQWENTHAADARSDLYALGCTLFYLLTGKAPFSDEKHSSLVGKMKGHTLDPIPDLKSARREAVADRPKLANDRITDELDALYRKLMAKRPEERFASANELAQALIPFGKSQAAASGVLVKESHAVIPSSPAAQSSPVAPRPESRASADASTVGWVESSRPTKPTTAGSVESPSPTKSNVSDGGSRRLDPPYVPVSQDQTEVSEEPTRSDPLEQLIPDFKDVEPTIAHTSPRKRTKPGAKKSANRWPLVIGASVLGLAVLAGIIIKITRKDGTVTQIEVPDDAKVEITSKKGAAPANGSSSSNPQPLTPNPLPDAPIDFAAERKAAEKLLAAKTGFMWLVTEKGDQLGYPIAEWRSRKLPDETFYIETVQLDPGSGATDDMIASLAGCTRLGKLWVTEDHSVAAYSDKGFRALRGFPRLWAFGVSGPVSDEAIAFLSACPNLIELNLYGHRVTDSGLSRLRLTPGLRKMGFPEAISDAGLSAVVEMCPNLTHVNVRDSAVTLAPLARLRRLREVICNGDKQFTEAGAATLQALPYLDTLSVQGVDQAGINRLQAFGGKLRVLQVKPNIRTVDWEPVLAARDVENLFLAPISLDTTLWDRIARLPALRELIAHAQDDERYAPTDIAAFRQRRPDVALVLVEGQTVQRFARLDLYPTGSDGKSLAGWELPNDAPKPAVVPFTADEATKLQNAWSAFAKLPVEETSKTSGMKFRLIPPSESVVDLPENRHALIRIAKPYYLGATEVTVGQFKKFIESTGYKTTNERNNAGFTWQNTGYPLNDDFPVNGITSADCRAFCEWLSKQDGAVYRLPTEAEWNHAAYAGGVAPYGFVTDPANAGKYGWVPRSMEGMPDVVRPVAKKAANPFGLFDVLGNVFEYCLTWGAAEPSSLIDPTGEKPVVRGSGCQLGESLSSRYVGEFAQNNTGFRILRQTTNELPPNPYKLSDKPLLVRKGEPLSPQATVSRPVAIPGVRSWSVELAGHQSGFVSVAWSPKGDRIATAGALDNTVRLWDREGNLIAVLLGHEDQPYSVSFSDDGLLLASCEIIQDSASRSSYGDVRVWDVKSGACRAVIRFPGWAQAVAFAPSGRQIAVKGGSEVGLILDLETGRRVDLVSNENSGAVCWSPDGKYVFSGSVTGKCRVWDAGTGEVVSELAVPDWLDGKVKHVTGVGWSPDGKWLAAASAREGCVRIWDARTREHVHTVQTGARNAWAICWHKDSSRLAVGLEAEHTNGLWAVIDVIVGRVVLRAEKGEVSGAIAWSPDGTEFAFKGQSGRLTIADAATGKSIREVRDRGRYAQGNSFLIGNNRVISKAWWESFSREFDAESGKEIAKPTAPGGHLLAVSSTGDWQVFNEGEQSAIVITNRPDATPVQLRSGTIVVDAISGHWEVDPTNRRLAYRSENKVQTWDVPAGIPLPPLDHPAPVRGMAWSPDGNRLATLAGDKVVRVWEVATGKLTGTFDRFPGEMVQIQPYHPLAWEPDGIGLLVALDLGPMQSVYRIDTRTGRINPPDIYPAAGIYGLTLAVDGDSLLVREGYASTYLRLPDGTRRLLGLHVGEMSQWYSDARRFLGFERAYGVLGFDTRRNERLGRLYPRFSSDNTHWLCIGPDGHWRGSDGIAEHLVYVAMLDDGSQRTYSAAEFAEKFGWKNDPNKAILLGKSESTSPPIRLSTSEPQSNSATKAPASDAVASLTPNKTAPITPSKTKLGALLEDVAALPPALNIPVSASKVEIPATLPKPKSGQPVSVRQIVTKPASLKDLASWSVEPAGHLGEIHAFSWSPSGEFLLTAGYQDDSLRLWRVEAGSKGPELRLARILLGEHGVIEDAQFSPDGRTVAATTRYGHAVAFYDVATGRRLSEFSLKDAVCATLHWTSDGKQVLAVSSPRIAMVDPVKGQVRTADQTANYADGALSPDERWIAAMDEAGKLRWFDSINLKVVSDTDLNTGRVGNGSLDWSPDGQFIVVGCHNDAIQIWDASSKRKTGDLIGHQTGGQPVGFVAFEPNRRRDVPERHEAWPRLMSASGGELIVWNIATKQPLARIQPRGNIAKAAWSPDGKWIATAGYNRLAIFDASTGQELTVNEIGRGFIEGTLNLSSNGKTMRLHHSDALSSWNADTGEFIQRVSEYPRGASLASPNDQWLAVYDSQQEKDNLWIVDSETCRQRTELRGHIGNVYAVNWSPDSKSLASAGTDKSVRIWNVADGQQTQQLDHDRAVRSVIWSPDGQQIATCADDDIIRIWTIGKKNPPPRPFDRLPSPIGIGPFSMNWSPDGKLIATATSDAGVRVLDIKSGKLSDPFIWFTNSIHCVAWSPDGKQLLAGNFWEVGYRAVTAKESAVVAGLGAPIFWHPDKRRFVTGCWGSYPIQAFDTRKVAKLGTLIPRFGPNGAHWACIGPDGYFRGSEDVESQLVVVAIAKDGSQRLHSIADFAAKYGWKNDPAKARLMKLDEAGGK